jgi:hypothetical protein
MKKVFQYFVKLLFVAILPIVAIVTSVNLYIHSEVTTPLIFAIVILIFVSFTNAIFFTAYMSTTKLFPKIDISIEAMPIIGLAIGINSCTGKAIIVLPFCAIDIGIKK